MTDIRTIRIGGQAHAPRQTGFTIVELLIATLVFSMVMLLITIGVLSFTRAYYKGVNQSNVQNTARTVLEGIAQSIQFSGDTVTSPISNAADGSQGFCLGGTRYSYVLGLQLTDETPDNSLSQTKHALVRDDIGLCGGLSAQLLQTSSVTPSGTELLSPNMRLAKLSVSRNGTSDVYKVVIRVVYGDDDLLFSPSGNSAGPKADDATCRSDVSGSEYCAVSELSTNVKKRIIQSQ